MHDSPSADANEADDTPQLSLETLQALQEFYKEQEDKASDTEENWQLSQFWYDEKTADVLAKEALRVAAPVGKIACVSCPTVYKKLQQLRCEGLQVTLFEYDRRFEVIAGTEFEFFDYNHPVTNEEFRNKFDLVLADPPFLSEECLKKTSDTIKFIAKDKIILCTGSVMDSVVSSCLGLSLCKFKPMHSRNLANEFSCYSNYIWE